MDFIPRIVYGDEDQFLIAFEFPPEGDPFGEKPKAVNNTVIAADGSLQSNQQFIERTFKVKLAFVSAALKAEFDEFFTSWGSLKKQFTYYPHSDVDTGAIEPTLVTDEMDYKRPLPAGGGEFLYEFDFVMRTVE